MSETKDPGIRVTNLLQLAQSDPKRLEELEQFRRALVVMFSDIQGSTAYFERYGDAAGLFMVHKCNETVRRNVEIQGGVVIKTIGDGTMATFPEPKSAVQGAIEIQRDLTELSATQKESEPVGLRIGLHYGTGIVRTNDVFGDVVNTASRVENVAAAGQIVISEDLYEKVRDTGFTVRELGRFSLKGKTGERTLYQVIWNLAPGVSASAQTNESSKPAPSYRLQVVRKDSSAGEEYPVPSEIAVGLSKAGSLIASSDFDGPWRARVFVQDGLLFVEERRAPGEGVFVRLANSYALEDQDVFLAGKQVFRYEEKPELAAPAGGGPSLGPATGPVTTKTAELVRTDSLGNPVGRYPLNAQEVQFGRTRGTYTFPDDNLMSRGHIRIQQRGEDFVLEDLGSRNGTFVKVRRKTAFPAGSALLIGGQLIKALC